MAKLLRLTVTVGLAGLTGLASCTNAPDYLQPQEALEVNVPGTMDTGVATTQIVLPVRLETPEEAAERAALEAELGVTVPYVGIDDLSIQVEWTVKNLESSPGIARIDLNGANELFAYVPLAFVFDPDEDIEPPPLSGDIPLEIPADGVVSGVFREDQLREAAIDLELITRGATNPFAALLQIHRDTAEFTDDTGAVVPLAAFGNLVRLDLSLESDSNSHMVLEYAVRVRDHEQIMHDLLLAAPADELTAFAPADFAPPPPPAP